MFSREIVVPITQRTNEPLIFTLITFARRFREVAPTRRGRRIFLGIYLPRSPTSLLLRSSKVLSIAQVERYVL